MLIVCGFSKKKTTCGVHQLAKKKPELGEKQKKLNSLENSEERLYNGGLWSLGRFNSFVTSILRSGSRRWQPKWECLNEAKTEKKINPETGRLAQHYLCALCGDEYTAKNVQVDHVIPIGKDRSWDEFIEALYCEKNNLQTVCITCHKKKTADERRKTKMA